MTNHPIRFARLGYCRLQCSDLEKSATFYRDLVGLDETPGPDNSRWMRCSDKPYDLVLEKGDSAGLSGVGYELESVVELDKAFEHLTALGHRPAWADEARCTAHKVQRALLVQDPVTGMELDFYAVQEIADQPFAGNLTKIAQLGHVVMNVTNLGAAHRFWVDQLGFAASDKVEGVAEWLRCWPNPLHHSLALLQGEKNTLHHINFMVTDIDDVGGAMNRLKAANVPIVFGPGRHLPSTSIFLYFLDPDGNPTEFSFGMELFEEEGAREARELEHKAEVMDIWGSRPDPRFGKGSPIVAAA
jgi:2,3-dihydroxy-p-cumate/2,3-dihydroxybenzoate 3,4-dioxygenase